MDDDPEQAKDAEEVHQAVETFNYQVKSWDRVTHAARFLLFLLYASAAIVLFSISARKNACFVQSTYKQEFVVNIVSNPFFSSNSVVRNAPLSKLEIKDYNAANFSQKASDIGMFPNMIMDVYQNSAFWPVALKPHPMVAAGEVIPSTRMDPGTYYFDPNTREVVPSGIPIQGGAAEAFKRMLLSYVKGKWRQGMQLPNFARCNRGHLPDPNKVYGTSAQDQAVLQDWLGHMMRFEQNSHLRGTCLLTGQQATVDMTSNYKTSMVLFSSVNVIFMLAVIMWITASFSLFYIGGMPRALEPKPGEKERTWKSEDIFMSVGIVWNVAGVIYVLVPDAQRESSIPLNNVVISVVALVSSILVQWNWANFRMFDVVVHDEAAKVVMSEEGMPIDGLEENPHYADESEMPDAIGGGADRQQNSETKDAWSNNDQDLDEKSLFRGGYSQQNAFTGGVIRLNTSNFLATANAVKNYGVKYAKYVANGGREGLRQRRCTRAASSALHLGTRIASMPRYTAMVKMGSPIAMYRYINILKKEMHNDSVQSLEYTITTPLLSAVVVSAISPTIPTGLVQWVAVSLLVSHLLCMPILYLSHFLAKHASNPNIKVYTAPVKWSIGMFLVACVGLQVIGFVIKLSYITRSLDNYSVDSILPASVWFMFVMQMFFVVSVLAVSLPTLVGYGDSTRAVKLVGEYSSVAYTFTNLMIKLVIGCMLASAAVNRQFPVFSCDIWEGKYATSNPIRA